MHRSEKTPGSKYSSTSGLSPRGAPIFSDNSTYFVDPIPQALTLTSIVIGACVTALALSIVIKIKKHYNSIESDDVRRIRG